MKLLHKFWYSNKLICKKKYARIVLEVKTWWILFLLYYIKLWEQVLLL